MQFLVGSEIMMGPLRLMGSGAKAILQCQQLKTSVTIGNIYPALSSRLMSTEPGDLVQMSVNDQTGEHC